MIPIKITDRFSHLFIIPEWKVGGQFTIKLSVTDESEQLYLSAFINELSIRPGTLFPEKNRFGFNDLTLSDTRVTIVDSSAKKKTHQTFRQLLPAKQDRCYWH